MSFSFDCRHPPETHFEGADLACLQRKMKLSERKFWSPDLNICIALQNQFGELCLAALQQRRRIEITRFRKGTESRSFTHLITAIAYVHACFGILRVLHLPRTCQYNTFNLSKKRTHGRRLDQRTTSSTASAFRCQGLLMAAAAHPVHHG